MDKSDKIFVTGHRGMVGSAVLRRLEAEGFGNIVRRARAQLDLTDQSAVAKFSADRSSRRMKLTQLVRLPA